MAGFDSVVSHRNKMPIGDKSKYSEKEKRMAEHIEETELKRGADLKTAQRIAWATVNKTFGGAPPEKGGHGAGGKEAFLDKPKTLERHHREGIPEKADEELLEHEKEEMKATKKRKTSVGAAAGGASSRGRSKSSSGKTSGRKSTGRSSSRASGIKEKSSSSSGGQEATLSGKKRGRSAASKKASTSTRGASKGKREASEAGKAATGKKGKAPSGTISTSTKGEGGMRSGGGSRRKTASADGGSA